MSSSIRKPLLSQTEIEAALREVASITRGVRVMLVGGVALHQYGSDRLTSDINIVAEKAIPALPAERPLTFGGYASHTPKGVPVDIILRDDDYAEVFAEALLYARHDPALPLPIVSLEYAIVMKMIAHRPKDIADLDTIFRLGVVDLPKARNLVRRLLGAYSLHDFDAMVREAEWRKGEEE